MNTLTNKKVAQTPDNYVSRYSGFPIYFHSKDQKFMRGLTENLDKNCPYVVADVNTWTNLDELSNYYYGRPDYYWVIADFNSIQDPFTPLFPKYKTLKIPSISQIKFK